MVVWLFEMLLDRDVLIPVSSSDRRRRLMNVTDLYIPDPLSIRALISNPLTMSCGSASPNRSCALCLLCC